jgi:hypothetical protein
VFPDAVAQRWGADPDGSLFVYEVGNEQRDLGE